MKELRGVFLGSGEGLCGSIRGAFFRGVLGFRVPEVGVCMGFACGLWLRVILVWG